MQSKHLGEKMLSKNRGFTLLGILVSLVIAGIAMQALMQGIFAGVRSSRIVENIANNTRLSNNLEMVFKNETTCKEAFNGAFSMKVQEGKVAVVGVSVPGAAHLRANGVATKRSNATPVPNEPNRNYYEAEVTIMVPIQGTLVKAYDFLLTLKTENDAQEPGKENILTCSRMSTRTIATDNTSTEVDARAQCAAFVGGYYDETLNPPKCRILFENRNSDPADPQIGQVWIRGDL